MKTDRHLGCSGKTDCLNCLVWAATALAQFGAVALGDVAERLGLDIARAMYVKQVVTTEMRIAPDRDGREATLHELISHARNSLADAEWPGIPDVELELGGGVRK